jgi:hypothetical protein
VTAHSHHIERSSALSILYNPCLGELPKRLLPTPDQRPTSRAGTVTITAHRLKEVRDRLKILTVRLNKTMNELMTKALDDPYRKHGG